MADPTPAAGSSCVSSFSSFGTGSDFADAPSESFAQVGMRTFPIPERSAWRSWYPVCWTPLGEPTWLHSFEVLDFAKLTHFDRLIQLKRLALEVQKLWFKSFLPEKRILPVVYNIEANLHSDLQPGLVRVDVLDKSITKSMVGVERELGPGAEEVEVTGSPNIMDVRKLDFKTNCRGILQAIEEQLMKFPSYALDDFVARMKGEVSFSERVKAFNKFRNERLQEDFEHDPVKGHELNAKIIAAFEAIFKETSLILGALSERDQLYKNLASGGDVAAGEALFKGSPRTVQLNETALPASPVRI